MFPCCLFTKSYLLAAPLQSYFDRVNSTVSQRPSLLHSLTLTHTHTLGPPGPTTGGVVYTRWGRTTCPNTTATQLLYAGRAAGSYATETTLLGHRMDEHTCMVLSIRLELLTRRTLAHFNLLLNTMSHVQCVTLHHEKLLWWFLHDLPAHSPGPENTMDISWQSDMIIIVQGLNVWTNIQSQCRAVQLTQMESYSIMLKWSATMEFPVHHTTHRRKSRV